MQQVAKAAAHFREDKPGGFEVVGPGYYIYTHIYTHIYIYTHTYIHTSHVEMGSSELISCATQLLLPCGLQEGLPTCPFRTYTS